MQYDKRRIKKIYLSNSFSFRGSIIHAFSYIESLLTMAIEFTDFENEEINNSDKYRLPIDRKIEHFKTTVSRYENKHSVSLGSIISDIKQIKTERDYAAHWLVCKDLNVLQKYVSDGVITLYNINKDNSKEFQCFSINRTEALIKRIDTIAASLNKIANSVIKEV